VADLRLGVEPEDFIWATGIEDTFVPQTRPGHRGLDEYELMDHYTHWQEDLALCADLGVKAVRWGVPWYRLEPSPGAFDWSWTDQVIPYIVRELGITPIIDLMHYGCPLWMTREFDNPEYPTHVAAYARAFAERYASLVRWYTPLNEPTVNAEWCGLLGRWPPYLRGDRAYVRLALQLADGMLRTVEALRTVQPACILVHVEAVGLTRATDPDLEGAACQQQLRRLLMLDLITGRVSREHPLFDWLVWHGAPPPRLHWLREHAIALDVLGLNFYPQWSTVAMQFDARNRLVRRRAEADGASFPDVVRLYHERYVAPLMITETSAAGSDEVRSDWLAFSLETIKQLRATGVPLLGYTWFPLFTMIDWAYRSGSKPKEDYEIALGLYQLARGGTRRWRPTRLVDEYRHVIRDADSAVGNVAGQCSITS
jgi:beta-glucosidase